MTFPFKTQRDQIRIGYLKWALTNSALALFQKKESINKEVSPQMTTDSRLKERFRAAAVTFPLLFFPLLLSGYSQITRREAPLSNLQWKILVLPNPDSVGNPILPRNKKYHIISFTFLYISLYLTVHFKIIYYIPC